MSDEENHVEPAPPNADELADRLFAITMIGVLGFIAVVFTFIL